MRKILVVEPSGTLATFQYAHNLANALAGRGHTVALATGIDFETRGYEQKYQALEVFDRFIPRPLRLFRFLRFLRRFRPDIVHIQGHSHPTSYLGIRALIGSIIATKFVYTAQDVIPKSPRLHHSLSLQRLYRVMDHLFVNARQNKLKLLERFPGVPDEKVTVVPLADLTHFVRTEQPQRPEFIPRGRQVVLFFGNIERRKGLLVLLRAFKQVLEHVPKAYLVAAGKPFDDMAVYQEEIARLGIGADVALKGEYVELEAIPGTFTFSDLLVLPYLEGWNSGVIATACAYQLPIVSSNIGGFHEVIRDGVTGLLVPPGDDERLADAIVRVLTDSELKARLERGLQAEAESTSWQSIAEQIEEVYCSVLGRNKLAAEPAQVTGD